MDLPEPMLGGDEILVLEELCAVTKRGGQGATVPNISRRLLDLGYVEFGINGGLIATALGLRANDALEPRRALIERRYDSSNSTKPDD